VPQHAVAVKREAIDFLPLRAEPLHTSEMIVLFTDFGLEGPYTGQVKAVPRRRRPR
jgi:hypothetical protein